MPSAKRIQTIRIGQLTGTTDADTWPLLVDPQGWPLLNDTGAWGVIGVDEGANTEHSDGRLYFFFGDVAPTTDSGNAINSDLVAWTDDTKVLRHGGHLALGLNFVLPHQPTLLSGQPDWRFCGKCHGLFWAGDPSFQGVCSQGGAHVPLGLNFVLPYEPTFVPGQHGWRFCGKCGGLFWDGDASFKGVCSKDGGTHAALGLVFVLPVVSFLQPGQPDWRFCAKCGGLFWDGDSHKGFCAGAPGGGFYLHPVLNDRGKYDPFASDAPIGQTLSLETPSGAFSNGGRVFVFAGIAEEKFSGQKRFGDPTFGTYLVSKDRPDLQGLYRKEFLFSPRIGACPRDASRDRLESHEVLGFHFLLPHDIADGPTSEANWRYCGKCEVLFWDGDDINKGHCVRGGGHQAVGLNYVLSEGSDEDSQNQANWYRCNKCTAIFWNNDPNNKGLCPGGGTHQATGPSLILPHTSIEDDSHLQGNWRFCGKCAGLFWDGDANKGSCPKDMNGHEARGLNFVLPHDFPVPEGILFQGNWRFCAKCVGLFFDGNPNFKGSCPKGDGHWAIGFNFDLVHDVNGDSQHQADWSFCGKCAGLFWNGDPDFKGFCPTGGGHWAIGFNFVLAHNPGNDVQTQAGWRFCTKCFGLVWAGQPDVFSALAPVVVNNADHPELPRTPHPLGVVLFGYGWSPSGNRGIRLAWMPLKTPDVPVLQDTLYYTGDQRKPPSQQWSSNVGDAAVLFSRETDPGSDPHISAAWLDSRGEGPKRWIVLYAKASDQIPNDYGAFRRPCAARIGTALFPLASWTDEIAIFDPVADQAYGKGNFMHWPNQDTITPDVPPREDANLPEHPGWAYGVFILNRFTEWSARTQELGIYYLLSPSSPYQVQLMYTRLRL
jgi:hypothetical protein